MKTEAKPRLATPIDEPELLDLIRKMHAEGGMRALDMDCVRETFARAFDRKGGILAVIGVPGHIRAMLYVLITRFWYTRESHLEELFNWVHPEHRKSDYSRILIRYAKKCSDEISSGANEKVPLIMGVLTNNRMAAKVRMYRQEFGIPYGAFFVHNATFRPKEELADEDLWRVPSIAREMERMVEAYAGSNRMIQRLESMVARAYPEKKVLRPFDRHQANGSV